MDLLKISMCDEPEEERPKIGDIAYGTPITGVPNGNGCVYIKMKKDSKNNRWSPGNCLLFNPKYGTSREVVGSTRIIPCVVTMSCTHLPIPRYREALKCNN